MLIRHFRHCARITIKQLVITFLFLLFLLNSAFAHANNNSPILKFNRLTIKQGLSTNATHDIAQDKQGFIWIATQDGLNRYDGLNVIQYRKKSNNQHSIADNFIRTVFVDKDNQVWVGTNNGLSRYNRELDNFDNFYSSVDDSNTLKDNFIWDIYQNNEGVLLVSTDKGLHKYNAEKGYFVRILLTGFEKELQAIRTIFQDNNNRYWLGTYENGIFLADSSFENIRDLKEQNSQTSYIPAQTLHDIKIIDQQYWLATNSGLYILGEALQIIDHFNKKELASDIIRTINQVNNHVWLGSENGLNTIDLSTLDISTYQKENHERALSDNIILKNFVDVNNNVWLATYEGINFYNVNQEKSHHYLFNYNDNKKVIETMAETADGNIWFSTEYNGETYLESTRSTKGIKLSINEYIHTLIADKQKLWFIDVNQQLFQLDTQTKEIIKEEVFSQKSHINLSTGLYVKNNKLWFIDTAGKLICYDYTTQLFQQVRLTNQDYFSHLTLNNSNVWVLNNKQQLIKYNIENQQVTKYKLNNHTNFNLENTNNIVVSNTHAFLGSSSQGVAVINLDTLATVIFNEDNQLNNNFINAILLDENNNAWLSTNKGISYINIEENKALNFYENLAFNDNEFMENAAIKSKNNNLYFGGNNGFHRFTTNELLSIENNITPPIITHLYIANKKMEVGLNTNKATKFMLEKSIQSSQQITLKHAESPFSLDFISPNTYLPERTKYRYRLLGLEKDWIDSGVNNHRATYTNLNAGQYTFEIQAYDRYQPDNVKSTSIDIKILPPWWLSYTALFFYFALLALAVIYVIQQLRYKHQYNQQIKKSEERLKLSLWGSGDEMWDWNILDGKIYRSNIWGLLDFPQDGSRNLYTKETNIHKADIKRVQLALNAHLKGETQHFEEAYRVKNKKDQWLWILDRGKVVEKTQTEQPARMTGTIKDINSIKAAEEKLKLFAKCIENSSDAIVIYDRQFIVIDVNIAFETLTQKTKEKMLGTSMRFSQYSKEFNQQVKKHLLTKGNWSGEIKSLKTDGTFYITELNIDIIYDEDNKISNFVGVFSDITERKKNEEKLRRLANTDTLTSLPNRSFFQSNQNKLVTNKIPHALLVFDLDNFKKINDSMGHEMGDILLCEVAKRLKSIGREQDTVYRLGGDEFSMLISGTNDIHIITSLAKDILMTIALPIKLRSQEVVLYSSIGIVLYPEDGINSEELLKNADTAMYHAKNLGGNKYQFFNESMNKQAVKRLQVENLIRLGLKEDYFAVHYQPKIDIKTGKISGMEALVRFETPGKGIIGPNIFIPVSEETGQIVEIGEVVLRKACYATKKWLDDGLFNGQVAVNLSAVQFSQPNLVSVIAQILLKSGLPAKHLELEITEGTVMDSPQKAIEKMLQIRSMGVHLSLDDFGTGYSSLSYLRKFPLNTLKIDKAFVDDIEESEQGRNMVATIVTIAHNLGLDVVAEGVENENQLSFLANLRCEQMQGFLYSKPLSEKDFSSYLLSQQITNNSTNFHNL